MVISMIALVGLVTLGGLTVLSVQGGIASSGHDRFKSIALYAAESGAAAAMDYLRKNYDPAQRWGALVNAGNEDPQRPAAIPGNQIAAGVDGNLFSPDMEAWYEVEILNNPGDASFDLGDDADGRVIIRSTGHGPNGATAQIEWEIMSQDGGGPRRPCPTYGQKGMAEDGAGRNDCLVRITDGTVTTYRPGGS